MAVGGLPQPRADDRRYHDQPGERRRAHVDRRPALVAPRAAEAAQRLAAPAEEEQRPSAAITPYAVSR
jgi:hypothetical protein